MWFANFYLAILTYFLRTVYILLFWLYKCGLYNTIVSYKVRIIKLAIVRKLFFILIIGIYNLVYIWQFWLYFSQLRVYIPQFWLYNSKFRVYISQFWEKMSELHVYIMPFWKKKSELWNINSQLREKSQNCEI